MGAGAVAAVALPAVPRGLGAARGRVHVVGAGLAGLACAADLVAAGVDVRVWEARARLGGRVLTDLRMVPGGWIECGGEFIDARHSAMRSLCRSLGVGLQDLLDVGVTGASRDLVGGRVHGQGWAATQDARLAVRARRDLRSLGEARLDRLSAAEWMSGAIGGWPGSAFARYRASLVRGEFGVEPSALSALWLVAELAEQAEGRAMQDDGAERFRIDGGTIRLVSALERAVGAPRIARGTRVVSVARRGRGAVLVVEGPDGRREEVADRVVITLPPPLVAQVDLRRAGVPSDVLRGIAAIGMGTNAKVIIPFTGAAWERRGWNGEGTSDTALGSTWQATMGQQVERAALTSLVGGRAGVALPGPDHGPAPTAVVAPRLTLADRVTPGTSASARAGAAVHAWARDPFARGSYSAARPGQALSAPDLSRPYGVVHFAGEHADDGFSGFMEGAVRSGQRAARQAIAGL